MPLRVFAACDVTAVGARFYYGFELHATRKLNLGVDAVNDADDGRVALNPKANWHPSSG
jgi:hypothetical protein